MSRPSSPAALDLFLVPGAGGNPPQLQIRMNSRKGKKIRSISYDFTLDEAVTLLAHVGVLVYSLLGVGGLSSEQIHTRLLAAHDQAMSTLRDAVGEGS